MSDERPDRALVWADGLGFFVGYFAWMVLARAVGLDTDELWVWIVAALLAGATFVPAAKAITRRLRAS